MIRCRPYKGENTLMMPDASPVIRRERCETCHGSARVIDEESAVSYGGFTICDVKECPDCEKGFVIYER